MVPDIYENNYFSYSQVFIAYCILEIPAAMIYLTACQLCSGLVGLLATAWVSASNFLSQNFGSGLPLPSS